MFFLGSLSASRERSARRSDPGGASIGCAAWFWGEAQPAQTSVGEQEKEAPARRGGRGAARLASPRTLQVGSSDRQVGGHARGRSPKVRVVHRIWARTRGFARRSF